MAVCWDSANCHCFATSDPRKGRFAACRPKSMCVDAGLFPYLVLDLVFFFYQNPSCSIQTRKRPASRFCLWASTVPTKKGPLETGVPMGFDQLKDRITPQVNFSLKLASMVLAGTGKQRKTKEMVKDREGKMVGMYVCMYVGR